MRAQAEWKVITHIARETPPTSAPDPVAHLARGLVGEGDREDLARPCAAGRQQPGDAVGEHPRLARAGAGEHQQRPLAVRDRLALRRVELGEQALLGARPGGNRGAMRGLHRHRIEDSRALGACDRADPGVCAAMRRKVRVSPGGARAALRAQLGDLALGGLAVELGESLLDLREPLRERLERVGDRVREVDPVRVGPLRTLAFDTHGVPRVADDGGLRRHIGDHHRVGAHLRPVAHRDRAEQLRPRADRDVVLERRMALSAGESGAAQRHPLVERHAVADLGGLADHDAGAVVDEEVGADPRGRDGSRPR